MSISFKSFYLKIFILFGVILGVAFFVSTIAYAIPLNGSGVPLNVQQFSQVACADTTDGTAELFWISVAGNTLADGTSSNPIQINAGQSIQLQWNVTGKYCNTGASDPYSNPTSPYYTSPLVVSQKQTNFLEKGMNVVSGSGVVTNFQTGNTLTTNWYDSTVYQNISSSAAFDLTATKAGKYQITLNSTEKAINTFVINGRTIYECVGEIYPQGQVAGPYDYQSCPIGSEPMNFYVNVNPSNVNISGTIYYHSGSTTVGLSGVNVSTCVYGVSAVSSSGHYQFSVNYGKGFCVEVPSQFKAQNGGVYSEPIITPGYILGGSPPPGIKTSCNGNNSSYQEQVAASPSSPGACNYGINDTSYNIAYKKYTPPISPPHRIGAPCPLPSWMSSGTSPISLPYNKLQPSGTHLFAPSPSYTTSPNSTYIQAVPYEWEITNAHDQYEKTITWKATGYQTSPSFTLIYTNYIKNYPYDKHITTVDYNEKYKETKYESASSPSFYMCGSTNNGSSSVCITYVKVCTYWQFKPAPGRCTKYGTKEVKSPATPYYSYRVVGRKIVTQTGGTYTVPQVLNEICPRNFDISGQSSITGVTLSGGTIDTPATATVSSNVDVIFSYLFGGSLIKPMSVHGLDYVVYYYTAPAAGSLNSLNLIGTSSPISISTTSSVSSNGGTSNISPPLRTINLTNISVGDKVCAQFTINPEQQEIDYKGDIEGNGDGFSANAEYGNDETSGRAEVPVYSTSSSYEDLGSPDSTSNLFTSKLICSSPVTNYPYTRVYGNDITNGVKFNGTQLTNPLYGLIGNRGTSSGTLATGSGSQFAAMAIGQIRNFATAFLRSLAPQSPNGLSFANNSGTYGGYFTSSRSVVYNYYARKPTALVPILTSSNQTFNVSTSSTNTLINVNDGIRTNSSYVQLIGNSSSSIHIRGQHIIYVNGNVYINNNVRYVGTPHVKTSTGTISNVPSLYVIALGNIYIGPNVSHLAGIYIAENQCDVPSLSASLNCSSYNEAYGGLINTCSDVNNNSTPSWHFHSNNQNSPSGKSLFTQCDTQLVSTGSLIADQVNLERTYASIRNSTPGENPFNGGGGYNCSTGNPSSMAPQSSSLYGCSAQVFDFNPINYLANPDFNSNQNENYDYIVSLPPVL